MAIGRFAVSCFLSFVVQASNDFFYLELTYDTYWRAFVFRGQAGRPPIVELRGSKRQASLYYGEARARQNPLIMKS